MNSRANGRLALIAVAATFAFAAVVSKPASACSAAQCPSNNSEQQGVAANALPTYPEPAAEAAAEPVKLKKFTKQAISTATRTQTRKAQLAQRARAGRLAAAHKRDQQDREAKAKRAKTVAFANANAQIVDADAAKDVSKAFPPASPFDKPVAAEAAQPQRPVAGTQDTQPAAVELVAADEFNELDRAAWDANQMPKLMQLKASGDSHAELRDDDSRWAQTSTLGKIFVAFGAMLTLGSAIRMFMA
jgi:hypothetical protein